MQPALIGSGHNATIHTMSRKLSSFLMGHEEKQEGNRGTERGRCADTALWALKPDQGAAVQEVGGP